MTDTVFDCDEWYYHGDRREMLKFVPFAVRNVLEVGCGAGNFLNLLAGRSIKRIGVEPNKKAYEEARPKIEKCFNRDFGDDLVRELIDEFGRESIDCIVFNDVLEHMADPEIALILTHDLLNPAGTIVASIPNFLFYSNIVNIIRTQDFKYERAGIMDNTHLRFFTKKSILRMFNNTGYKITKIEGISEAQSLKFRLLNALLFGHISDCKYMQFAVVCVRDRL